MDPEASQKLHPLPHHFSSTSTFSSHPDIPVSAMAPPATLGPLQSDFSEIVKAALLCSTVLITGLAEVPHSCALRDRATSWLFSSCLFCSLVAFSPSCIKIDVPWGLMLPPFCTVSMIRVIHPAFAHNLCTDLTLQLWPYVPLVRGVSP